MKAVVLTAPRHVEIVDDWPEPEPGPDDVVVAMRGLGLCGSDLSVYDGARTVPATPWVMGHEGGGDIVAVGTRVETRTVGQRVVIEPNYPCLACAACRAGHGSACDHRAIVGMNLPGLLAQRVVVPSRFTWPVPADTPGHVLASVEPLVVANSAVRRSGASPGDRCLVVGAGSQGLLVCLSLIAIGAQPFVLEPHRGRADLALAMGASDGTSAGEFSIVFETAGVSAAVRTAVERAAPLGTVVFIGLDPAALPLSPLDLVRRQLTLKGALIYNHPDDFADSLAALGAGELRLDRLAYQRFTPESVGEAFAQAREVAGKTWIDLSVWCENGTG